MTTLTKKELVEWLNQFPDDAQMECLEEYNSGYACHAEWVDMTIDDLESLDFRYDNAPEHVKDKVFIRIGRK